MMRVAVVWRWGGIYSDTDVICMRNMALFNNTLGYIQPGRLANGFFKFEPRHIVMHKLMVEITQSFSPTVWAKIGPPAITAVMKRECQVKRSEKFHSKVPYTCGNVTLYPEHYFFPIHYRHYQEYFVANRGKTLHQEFKSSLLLHTWNKANHNNPMFVGGDSIYDVAARTYCPAIYQYASRRSHFF
ncbi:lactosylceramide 4-alpha-galactosyltransferase-like [Homarus americanus]|nr:lactosylceramide 4-alpha-galactosyltransferase-like [Homarus americanus]